MASAMRELPLPSAATPMPDSRSRYDLPSASNRRTPSPRTNATGKRRYVCRTCRASRAWMSLVAVVSTVPLDMYLLHRDARAGGLAEALRIAPVNNRDFAHAGIERGAAGAQLGDHAGRRRAIADQGVDALEVELRDRLSLLAEHAGGAAGDHEASRAEAGGEG